MCNEFEKIHIGHIQASDRETEVMASFEAALRSPFKRIYWLEGIFYEHI